MSAAGFSAAQQKVQTLVAALREVAALIGEPDERPVMLRIGASVKPGLGLTGDAASLAIRARDMEQGIFKVLVLGEFKNGKSTLLNAMLGHKTLPARAAPATAIITELVYGGREDVAIYETGSPGPRRLSWEEFVREFQLNEQDIQTLKQQQYLNRFQQVEYAQIECKHPFCANGVRLIDSPGLGEHISRTRVTTNFLKQAQAVIFVLNAISILSESERVHIERLGAGRLNQVFFIINRVNQIDQQEVANIKDWVRQSLKHHFLDEQGQFDEALYGRRVFFVNAKGALDARVVVPNQTDLLEASGVLPLEAELERFLTTDERVTASLEGTVQALAAVVAEARRRIAQQQRSLGEPLQELERRRVEAEQRLTALELTRHDIERTLHFFGESLKQKIYLSLLDWIEKMYDTWPEDSLRLINLTEAMQAMDLLKSLVSREAKERVIGALKREIRSYLQVKLTEWSESLPGLVQPDVKKLVTEMQAQIDDFQRELEAIEGVFADGKTERRYQAGTHGADWLRLLPGAADLTQLAGSLLDQGDWEGFFSQALQQAVTMDTIFSFFGGIGSWSWLLILVDEFMGQVTQRPIFSSWVLKPLGEKLHATLAKEAPARQNDIYRGVERVFTGVSEQLTRALSQQVEEARREQRSVIHAKEQEGFSADQEKRRLGWIGEELLAVLDAASQAIYGRSLTAEELDRLAGGEHLAQKAGVAKAGAE